MKITIISAYTWFNKGDAGILMGTITELTEYFGEKNVEFNVLSFTPEVDRAKYKKFFSNVIEVQSNIFNPYPVKKDKINKAKAIIRMGLEYFYFKFFTIFSSKLKKNISIKLCEESDLIIVCGGGFLGGNKYNSLIHLAQIDILKELHIPMILWGASIEPPRKTLLKYITEKVLSNLNMILPRESITEKYLRSFYSENKIISTPDMAFKTSNIENSEKIDNLLKDIKNESKNKKIIGITMREWFFPKSKNPEKQKKQYEKAIITLINQREDNFIFVFVPQVIMDGDDDRLFANKIKSQLNNPKSLIVLENDYSPYELKFLIKKFDQFLGTRMHSNIFSSTVCKAPVAIAYEKKTNGIMEKLELEEYVVDIEEVNSSILDELLNKNYQESNLLTSNVGERVEILREEIRNATKEVFNKVKI